MSAEVSRERQVQFREVQRFRQAWLWVLLVPTMLLPMAALIAVLVKQGSSGRPVGNHPLSTAGLALVTGGAVAVCGGILALFVFARLIVEVREDVLRIRFVPFHRRFVEIPLAEIASHAARRYRPIAEYGGWGIRGLGSNRAYNTGGDRGVQLVLRDSRRILIGSRRADELDAALARPAAP